MLAHRAAHLPASRVPAPAVAPSARAAPAGRAQRRGVRALVGASYLDAGDDGDLSFYELLGVHPTADARTIKKAYHTLMREVHPDTVAGTASSTDASDERDAYYYDTTDLCVILNDVYQTLTDPELRATYDALVGFSVESVNPFYDKSFERDQVFVDEVSCIGCGKCVRSCPGAFVIESSKYGRARVTSQPRGPDQQEDVQIAMETCPVDCIHWVSSPQLSLLEAALSKMDRVDAFVMMRRGGVGGDVFHEASKAWHRRQAAARARVQARAGTTAATAGFGGPPGVPAGGVWGGLAGVFNQHVDWSPGQSGGGADGGAARPPGAAGRVADLAAKAAQSARLWRMANAMKGEQRVLSE